MTEILNNPWVTGIGGGIISSLIVFFVTRYAFSRKEKKEYNQKLETANNEILYSIRPLIIEKKIPSSDIFQSIRLATSKKYGVNPEDLYSEFSISNDLINEIMNNSFLSSDQKLELCELLNTMKTPKTSVDKSKEIEIVYVKEKDGLSSKYNSILLAMVSFATVLAMTLTITQKGLFETEELLKDKFSILITATIIPLMAMTLLYVIKDLKNREKNRESKEKTKKKEENEE
jgi:large-conductance mechanosensitive channel